MVPFTPSIQLLPSYLLQPAGAIGAGARAGAFLTLHCLCSFASLRLLEAHGSHITQPVASGPRVLTAASSLHCDDVARKGPAIAPCVSADVAVSAVHDASRNDHAIVVSFAPHFLASALFANCAARTARNFVGPSLVRQWNRRSGRQPHITSSASVDPAFQRALAPPPRKQLDFLKVRLEVGGHCTCRIHSVCNGVEIVSHGQ